MTLAALRQLVAQGEGPTLEFKRTTGKVREGLETVCAFLNGAGGQVLFGVSRTGGPRGPAGVRADSARACSRPGSV